jgi:cell division protein FtsA
LSGSRLEVTTYFVTGDAASVDAVEEAVSRAGRAVDQYVLGALGSGTAVLSPEEAELGAAAVDIGAGTTEVAVFQNGAISHSASIPIGGSLVSSDVAKLLKTSPQEAESLKLRYGAALAELVADDATIDVLQLGQIERRPMMHRVFLEIIEARMAEIAKLVRQQIERSGTLGSLNGGVTLTGGGSLLPGTTDLFQRVLQHPKVRTVRPDLEGPYGELASKPTMARCVGSALFLLEACTDELAVDGEEASVGGRIRSFFANLGGR